MISIPEELRSTLSLRPGPKLRRGKYGKHVTCVPSRKNGRTIVCETILETHFCIELERSPCITHYQAQPFTLALTNSRKCYTPDFVACHRDGTIVLYEIKHDAVRNDLLTLDRLDGWRELLNECGYELERVFENQFFHPIKTDNLHLLYQQSFGSNFRSASTIRSLIQESPQKQLLVEDLITKQIRTEDIAHAVFYGSIATNLTRPFTLHSRLRCGVNDGK